MPGRAAASPPAGDVRLRDVTESDLAAFYEHQRDPDAARRAASSSEAGSGGEAVEGFLLVLRSNETG